MSTAPTSSNNCCYVAVHVGAGYHSQHKSKAYKQAMRQACDAAIAKLTHGASANDAAECAIKALEDSPVTNAGIGSNLNRLGLVECDASMMCTNPDAFGAVGAVSEICNPIQAANALLKTSSRGPDQLAGLVPPMLLVGRGADEWAKTQGVPTSSNTREKITEESLKKYEGYMKRAFSVAVEEDEEGLLMDTVGAVCIDGSGNIAAGVSSGGIALKLPGRIGEAAVFGSGCWAERRSNDSGDSKATVGCSVTGTGEQIMRTMLAKDCAQRDGDLFTVLEDCFANFTTTSALNAYSQRSAGLIILRQDSEGGRPGKKAKLAAARYMLESCVALKQSLISPTAI